MRIIYVANHGQTHSNDDEGAIAHALRELGHEVIPVQENRPDEAIRISGADFVLFHHWREAPLYLGLFTVPTVMWYFDLINAKDPSVAARSHRRMWFVDSIMKQVDAGFFTDGDWVAQQKTGKEIHLMQGADGRIVGKGNPLPERTPLLFPGTIRANGTARIQFVSDMGNRYGKSFTHLRGVYRENLRAYIAGTDIVVCPPTPVTDRYYSNRVYLTAGFGACILHPHSSVLRGHFGTYEVMTYPSQYAMHDYIKWLQDRPSTREHYAENALARVLKEHLYLHRVQTLITVLKDKGIV